MSFSNFRSLLFSLFIPNFQHSNPKFIHHSNPKFIHHFPFSNSTTKLYSRLHDGEEDEHILVSSFNRLLHKNPTPPIIHFGMILGSLVKANHYSIAKGT